MKSKALFAILIIIILGVIAWLAYSYRNVLIPSGAESTINNLESQGTSDEVSNIESDLNSTVLDGLDNELSDIESELQGASY